MKFVYNGDIKLRVKSEVDKANESIIKTKSKEDIDMILLATLKEINEDLIKKIEEIFGEQEVEVNINNSDIFIDKTSVEDIE